MAFLRSASNFVSSKTKGSSARAQKNTNKSIAKDPNVRVSSRLRAAGRAMKKGSEEAGHNRRADAAKHAAKHNY